MQKSIIIVFVLAATTIQICISESNRNGKFQGSPEVFTENEIEQTKRFKLAKFAYDNLQRTVWPKELYESFTKYMDDLKDWTLKDKDLQRSHIYNEVKEEVESCIGLLKQLVNEPDNCDKQAALKDHHKRIQDLLRSEENQELRYRWLQRYAEFLSRNDVIMKKSYNEFYTALNEKLNQFENNLDANEKIEEHDILEWHKRFQKEMDFIRKQILLIEFMSIFYDERVILEKKCKVKYQNGF